MIGKRLKYYRLKNNLSMKELADKVGITSMAISNYESDKRKPSLDIIKKLASALNINVTDFIESIPNTLDISYGKFRKSTRLSESLEELIKASIDDYLSRLFQVLSFTNEYQIIDYDLINNKIIYNNDIESTAEKLRIFLDLPINGPINRIVDILENKGIIVFFIDIDTRYFSGLNGVVNNKPYIVVNKHMAPARIRSTIIHELIHIVCCFNDNLLEKEEEKIVDSITGVFMFPKNDVIRELGVRRTIISKDMSIICTEYGISMFMLVKRARFCNVINDNVEKAFYINASKLGWKTDEPTWDIIKEENHLFEQLVLRAVTENTITVQKGAELLRIPFSEISKRCYF